MATQHQRAEQSFELTFSDPPTGVATTNLAQPVARRLGPSARVLTVVGALFGILVLLIVGFFVIIS